MLTSGWLLTDGGDDISFRCFGLGHKSAQRLRRILQQAWAYRPFSVYETPDGAFIYTQTPRGRSCASKNLDAVGKVLRKILL